MKWNTQGARWQESRKGTARAHLYYFITQHGTGNGEWQAGYYGFGKQIVMNSAGTFKTAQEAREYCEKKDAEAVLIVGEPTHPVYAEGGALHRKILGM
jgi:hypothetical protein